MKLSEAALRLIRKVVLFRKYLLDWLDKQQITPKKQLKDQEKKQKIAKAGSTKDSVRSIVKDKEKAQKTTNKVNIDRKTVDPKTTETKMMNGENILINKSQYLFIHPNIFFFFPACVISECFYFKLAR